MEKTHCSLTAAIRLAVIAVFTVVAGGGVEVEAQEPAAAEADWIIPEDISTYGHEIDGLFWMILVITGVVGVGVLGLMGYALVKFRAQDGRRATFSHGSGKLEVGWTLATAVILIFIAFAQKGAWGRIKQSLPPENESFLVRVFAEQFAFHFVYPGADGTFEGDKLEQIFPGFNPLGLDDPSKDVILQELVVPVETPVILELNSLGKFDPNAPNNKTPGVLHAFFSPHLRLKQDIVPYMKQRIWFQATKTGTYEIACAELCGLGHYQMNAPFRIAASEDVSQAIGYDWKAAGTFPATFGSESETE